MKKYHWRDDWNRQRPRRLSLSVTDEEADQVNSKGVEPSGHQSKQGFMWDAVWEKLKRIELAVAVATLRESDIPRCPECHEERPGDDRVAGPRPMKCGPCSYPDWQRVGGF